MASRLLRPVLLLFLAVLSIRLVEAAAEGGPSSFGYDASSACSKPFNRVGRARIENLPCDFSRESWCTIAGNDYPWHAVRRFVQENQGLMRRMYGDERHMSVLKNELEKDDVEVEVEGESNHLYNDDASPQYRHFSYGYDDQNFESTEYEDDYEPLTRVHRGRSLNTGSSSKLDNLPENLSRLHPNETPTVSTTTTSSPSSSTPTWSPTTSSTTTTTTSKLTSSTNRSKILLPVTSAFSSTPPSTTASDTSTTSTPTTSSQSFNDIDRMDVNVDELTKVPDFTTLPSFNGGDDDDDDGVEDLRVISTSENPDEIAKVVGLKEQEASTNDSQPLQPQQFRPRPEYKPTEATKTESGGGNMEGQLFQEVASKDKQEAVLKVRGINACPTKIEMIAPFWGNSTRGEILALLNLYPFEQYVHYEKCTNENKQMYCRDGCRCEQQYRVHRLLAYDPNNECRGIFSDWFRFPSCCTCHCYDLPLEFRVTSRSPRTNLISTSRQKVKVRAPNPPPLQSKRRRRGN